MELDANTLESLRELGRPRRYRAGQALFLEGDPAGAVALIEAGRVKVAAVTVEGREVILAIRGPGELVGELSALDEEPRSAGALAMEDVDATVVPTEQYLGWLREHPGVMLAQLVSLVGRMRDSDAKRVELAAYDIDQRVVVRLVQLANEHGEEADDGSVRITLALSQEELGAFTGASREAVARTLQRLRRRGIVETSRRGLVITDLAALRQFGP